MGEIAPFLLFTTTFCDLILDFCVKTRTRFSFRDKRLFEIIEVKITRVDCTIFYSVKIVFFVELEITPRIKDLRTLTANSKDDRDT